MEFKSDIKFSENTSYYFSIIEKFIGYDQNSKPIMDTPNFNLFIYSAYIGLTINKNIDEIKLNKMDDTIQNSEKTVPRTVLIRHEHKLKELLLSTKFVMSNYNVSNNTLQQVWNLENFNSDKELFTYLMKAVDVGAKYTASLCFSEIPKNITQISKEIDKSIDENINIISNTMDEYKVRKEKLEYELDKLDL